MSDVEGDFSGVKSGRLVSQKFFKRVGVEDQYALLELVLGMSKLLRRQSSLDRNKPISGRAPTSETD